MAASWAITGQLDGQLQVGTAGQVITGTVIYFQTGEGNQGSVFIPQTRYDAKEVRKVVQVKADVMDEVSALRAGEFARA